MGRDIHRKIYINVKKMLRKVGKMSENAERGWPILKPKFSGPLYFNRYPYPYPDK